MFITFEGIDGSGKTTQIQKLKKYLEDKGQDVLLIREPGGTDFSEKMRDLLLDVNNDINSVSELFLFECARADLTQKKIIPALEQGKHVICDRFFDSTSAYQGYGRGLDLDKIFIAHKLATYNIEPDLTFYLRVQLSTSELRNAEKRKDRMESAGKEFFQKVINGFDDLADRFPGRIKVINGELDPEKVFEKVISYLS